MGTSFGAQLFLWSVGREMLDSQVLLGSRNNKFNHHVTVNITFKNTLLCLFTDLGRHKLSNAVQYPI